MVLWPVRSWAGERSMHKVVETLTCATKPVGSKSGDHRSSDEGFTVDLITNMASTSDPTRPLMFHTHWQTWIDVTVASAARPLQLLPRQSNNAYSE
ncbi:hypothetical protein AVEN_151091-1 [Araneus ventricosus]|uniref:Uncharacterized protein n=1 Tax=Araneus ventricosus TaxID=182803 RepID=A0A4Y2Q3G8_ARAVE|nr:hypothetical protein AVEN_151091-1 [Araneus ventricosus]